MRRARVWFAEKLVTLAKAIVRAEPVEPEEEPEAAYAPSLSPEAMRMIEEGERAKVADLARARAAKVSDEAPLAGSLRARRNR